jgi:hypothetical protein
MEFFIPSIFLFLLAVGITFAIAPKLTPFVMAVLSLALLVFGVYYHHKLFAYEYRLSTWQDSLKIYAPAIMIGAVILVILYGILSFFTGGQVPVPTIPDIEMPKANTATNMLTEAINNATESIGNITNNILPNNGRNNANKNRNEGNNERKNKNGNNLTRSFLEVI